MRSFLAASLLLATSSYAYAVEGLPSTLIPSGPVNTLRSQIVDNQGKPVRLACIGWNQVNDGVPLQRQVLSMVVAGFNCIRLSWVNATKADDLARIDRVVALAGPVGLRVILDNHTNEDGTPGDGWGAQQRNGLWFDVGPGTDGTNGAGVRGTVSDAKFTQDWVDVARHYAGNQTVIGFDIRNEPTTGFGNGIRWGGGGPTDIHAMYQRVGAAIQAVNPDPLIICEGYQDYGGNAPQGDLRRVGALPVSLPKPNKVVYSVHEYPSEISATAVDSGPGYIQRMNDVWGYLITQDIAPVWIGELGASMDSEDGKAWADTIAPYLNGQAPGGLVVPKGGLPPGTDWWAWGHLDGQMPNGTLASDWQTIKPEQGRIFSQFAFHGDATASTNAYAKSVAALSVGTFQPISSPLPPDPLLLSSPALTSPAISTQTADPTSFDAGSTESDQVITEATSSVAAKVKALRH